MAKKKATFSLDSYVIEQIKSISQQEQRSISQQVNKILSEYIERYRKSKP